MTFNKEFFKPNRVYTREMAEHKLIEKGFKNFQFKSASYTHGASFYFTSEDGKEIRVSDHPLTGDRALETIQVSLVEYKTFPFKRKEKSIESLTDQFKAQLKIELKSCSKGIYPSICKIKDTDRGFEEVFKNVYDICSKTGMPIDSALAQYESTLN